MSGEFVNSFLWQLPRSIKQVNIQGIKFPEEKTQVFNYSNDGKYFAYVSQQQIYIINCFQEKQTLIQLDSTKVFGLLLHSEYLILDVEVKGSNFIYIYKNSGDSFQHTDTLNIQSRSYLNFDFKMKGKNLYILNKQTSGKMLLQIFNLQFKQNTQVTLNDYVKCYWQSEILFPYCNSVIILKHNQSGTNSKFCFLVSTQGKIMKATKKYNRIEGVFGLDCQARLFRLYYVSKDKLLKKFNYESQYMLSFSDNKMHLLNKDLIVQIRMHNIREQETCLIEVKCFKFEIRKHCYKGIKAINKKGAFQMQNNNIFEFYCF